MLLFLEYSCRRCELSGAINFSYLTRKPVKSHAGLPVASLDGVLHRILGFMTQMLMFTSFTTFHL